MQFDVRLGSSIGVAVRELEPVIDLYAEGFGLGPFEIREVELPGALDRAGGASPARVRMATAPLGICEMELIETLYGRPPHADFLDERGEGMNHLNLDKCTAEGYLETLSNLYWRGIEPFWGLPFGSFCYVESEPIGGVTFEVMVGSGHAGKKGHNHLGLVISDTQKTIDFYTQSLGMPAFRTGEYPMPRGFYRQERIKTSFRASFCDLGPTELVLYQDVEGSTPTRKQIESRGEGMNHLCLNVEDLGACIAEYQSAGIDTIWQSPELSMAYLDTAAIGGMTVALAQK